MDTSSDVGVPILLVLDSKDSFFIRDLADGVHDVL